MRKSSFSTQTAFIKALFVALLVAADSAGLQLGSCLSSTGSDKCILAEDATLAKRLPSEPPNILNQPLVLEGSGFPQLSFQNGISSLDLLPNASLTLKGLRLVSVVLHDSSAITSATFFALRAFKLPASGGASTPFIQPLLYLQDVTIQTDSCAALRSHQRFACEASPSPTFTVSAGFLHVSSFATPTVLATNVTLTCGNPSMPPLCWARTATSGPELLAGLNPAAAFPSLMLFSALRSVPVFLFLDRSVSLHDAWTFPAAGSRSSGASYDSTSPSPPLSAPPGTSGAAQVSLYYVYNQRVVIAGSTASSASAPSPTVLDFADVFSLIQITAGVSLELRNLTLLGLPWGQSASYPDGLLRMLMWSFSFRRRTLGVPNRVTAFQAAGVAMALDASELALWHDECSGTVPPELAAHLCVHRSRYITTDDPSKKLACGTALPGGGLFVRKMYSLGNEMSFDNVLLLTQHQLRQQLLQQQYQSVNRPAAEVSSGGSEEQSSPLCLLAPERSSRAFDLDAVVRVYQSVVEPLLLMPQYNELTSLLTEPRKAYLFAEVNSFSFKVSYFPFRTSYIPADQPVNSFKREQVKLAHDTVWLGVPFGSHVIHISYAPATVNLHDPNSSLTVRNLVLLGLPAAGLHRTSPAWKPASPGQAPTVYDGDDLPPPASAPATAAEGTASGGAVLSAVAGRRRRRMRGLTGAESSPLSLQDRLMRRLTNVVLNTGSAPYIPRVSDRRLGYSNSNGTYIVDGFPAGSDPRGGLPAGLTNFTSCLWALDFDRRAFEKEQQQQQSGAVTSSSTRSSVSDSAGAYRAFLDSVVLVLPPRELAVLIWAWAEQMGARGGSSADSSSGEDQRGTSGLQLQLQDDAAAADLAAADVRLALQAMLTGSRLADRVTVAGLRLAAARLVAWANGRGETGQAGSGGRGTPGATPPSDLWSSSLTLSTFSWCGLRGRNVTLAAVPPPGSLSSNVSYMQYVSQQLQLPVFLAAPSQAEVPPPSPSAGPSLPAAEVLLPSPSHQAPSRPTAVGSDGLDGSATPSGSSQQSPPVIFVAEPTPAGPPVHRSSAVLLAPVLGTVISVFVGCVAAAAVVTLIVVRRRRRQQRKGRGKVEAEDPAGNVVPGAGEPGYGAAADAESVGTQPRPGGGGDTGVPSSRGSPVVGAGKDSEGALPSSVNASSDRATVVEPAGSDLGPHPQRQSLLLTLSGPAPRHHSSTSGHPTVVTAATAAMSKMYGAFDVLKMRVCSNWAYQQPQRSQPQPQQQPWAGGASESLKRQDGAKDLLSSTTAAAAAGGAANIDAGDCFGPAHWSTSHLDSEPLSGQDGANSPWGRGWSGLANGPGVAPEELVLSGELGRGAQGVVFRGRWKGLEVAVKSMLFQKGGPDGDLRSLHAIREAAISVSLCHPNVVATYTHQLARVDPQPLHRHLRAPASAAAAAASHGTAAGKAAEAAKVQQQQHPGAGTPGSRSPTRPVDPLANGLGGGADTGQGGQRPRAGASLPAVPGSNQEEAGSGEGVFADSDVGNKGVDAGAQPGRPQRQVHRTEGSSAPGSGSGSEMAVEGAAQLSGTLDTTSADGGPAAAVAASLGPAVSSTGPHGTTAQLALRPSSTGPSGSLAPTLSCGNSSGELEVWQLTLVQELCDAGSLRHCLESGRLAAAGAEATAHASQAGAVAQAKPGAVGGGSFALPAAAAYHSPVLSPVASRTQKPLQATAAVSGHTAAVARVAALGNHDASVSSGAGGNTLSQAKLPEGGEHASHSSSSSSSRNALGASGAVLRRGDSISSPSSSALPAYVALAAALQIARGMRYLHSLGVLHGDLSSANVLLQTALPSASLTAPAGIDSPTSPKSVRAAAQAGAGAAQPMAALWRSMMIGGAARPPSAFAMAVQPAVPAAGLAGLYGIPGGNGNVLGGGVRGGGLGGGGGSDRWASIAPDSANRTWHGAPHAGAWGLGYVLKVSDFGLSGRLQGSQTHLSEMCRRSSLYSAPELVDFGIVSKATDVYAFAVLLYELAVGVPLPPLLRHPRHGPPLRAWLTAQHSATPGSAATSLPPGLLVWPEAVPVGYVELAAECLREDPDRRPGFQEVCERLEALLQAATMTSPQ